MSLKLFQVNSKVSSKGPGHFVRKKICYLMDNSTLKSLQCKCLFHKYWFMSCGDSSNTHNYNCNVKYSGGKKQGEASGPEHCLKLKGK